MVIELKTLEEFAEIIKKYPDRLIVIDFFADWCGPCKRIAPFFASLAEKYENATFLKVNTDNKAMSDLINACSVQSLPSFYFFYGEDFLDKTTGADPITLEKFVVDNLDKKVEKKVDKNVDKEADKKADNKEIITNIEV